MSHKIQMTLKDIKRNKNQIISIVCLFKAHLLNDILVSNWNHKKLTNINTLLKNITSLNKRYLIEKTVN